MVGNTRKHSETLGTARFRSETVGEGKVLLQASNILNEAYAQRLCAKLAAQEEKCNKKKLTKLVGDGLPQLLSGDEFYELVQEKEKEMHEATREKERKKDGRALYKVAVEEWEVEEQARRDAN